MTLKDLKERVRMIGVSAASCSRAVLDTLRGYSAEMGDMRVEMEKALA